ncbi:MAG: CpsD/CapB family tyrosine-protein kinase [Pseudomonadales bacterium]
MDYIQQAIDKARDERQGKIGQEREERAADTAPVVAKNGAVQKGVLSDINYTKTRQVELNEAALRQNRVIAGFNFDKRAEPYRQLRTQVLQKLRSNSWKTLAITSPNENAGKTLTAVNLAISLSMEVNQTVMLVDLDLRSPKVLKTLAIDVEQGLVDHLKGEVSVEDILVNPDFERLVILPGKADPNYSSEILSSPEMTALLNDLTHRYESRIIIFDLPALLSNDDALVFTPFVDAALLVVEDGITTPDEVERALQLLEGTHLLGTILNKAES